MSKALLEKTFQEYQHTRSNLAKLVGRKQQLETQLKENETVQKEFQLLSNDANIFKLIGPTLLKQDKNEARSHVKTRLEFIRNEIQKLDEELKVLELQEQEQAKQVSFYQFY